jgi:hypothetical protein
MNVFKVRGVNVFREIYHRELRVENHIEFLNIQL